VTDILAGKAVADDDLQLLTKFEALDAGPDDEEIVVEIAHWSVGPTRGLRSRPEAGADLLKDRIDRVAIRECLKEVGVEDVKCLPTASSAPSLSS